MNEAERTAAIAEAKAAHTGGDEYRLWALGRWQPVPVIRVPVAALVLNIDNRRFTAERQLFEAKLNRSLDPENSEADALSVESILLDKDLVVDDDRVIGKEGKDYLALRQDWLNRTQESPLWIRPDGTVRNGNRRLAMLRRLSREQGSGGHEYVDAIVLDPTEFNELAVFEMEQREQLTEDYKLRYTDINLLLAIKDAAEDKGIDWYDDESIEDVAGQLQHVMRNDRNYAIVQLYAIKYMREFLEDLDAPDQFEKLIGQIERFRDVGRIMRFVTTDDPDRASDMLSVLFAGVNAGLNHLEIRRIRSIYTEDKAAFDALVASVVDAEGDWVPPADADPIADPEVVDDEDPDPEATGEQPEGPGPAVTDYPQDDVRAVIEDAIDRLDSGKITDVVKTTREINNRLAALVDGAPAPLLEALGADSAGKVRAAVDQLLAWFDEHGDSLRP